MRAPEPKLSSCWVAAHGVLSGSDGTIRITPMDTATVVTMTTAKEMRVTRLPGHAGFATGAHDLFRNTSDCAASGARSKHPTATDLAYCTPIAAAKMT